MSIRLRLTLLFTVAVLVLLVGGGGLFVTRLRAGLEQSLALTLGARADNLAAQLAPVRVPLTESYLRRHRLQRSINGTYAELLTVDGRVIDNSQRVADSPLLTPQQARVAAHRTLYLDRTVRLSDDPDSDAVPMRLLARRIRPSGDLLVVAINRNVAETAVTSARNALLVLGAVVLVLAGVGAWLLTRAALRPVERMRLEVRELHARGAADALHVPRTRDEIARLAETFNLLLAQLRAALAREQALVADAGHELRTPLTVLKGELELAQRPHRTAEELAATIAIAAVETDRLVGLTEDLLFLSNTDGRPGLAAEEFDLVAVATEAVRGIERRADQRGVRVELAAPAPVRCPGNRGWVRRAIDNLLANAVRYAPPGSVVCLEVRVDGDADGDINDIRQTTDALHIEDTLHIKDTVHVTVTDEGPGFPPSFLPIAFDRFTRADDSRLRSGQDGSASSGTGLGLAIVASVAARHGGSVYARNRPEGGAEVGFGWPIPAPSPLVRSISGPSSDWVGGGADLSPGSRAAPASGTGGEASTSSSTRSGGSVPG